MGRARRPASGIEAFWDLERFLVKASRAHLGLPEVERESELRGRELIRLALQAHLDGRGSGDVGKAIVVAGADGPVRLGYKKLHRRRILTLFGELNVTRLGYAAPGHRAIHPLDAELQLPGRTYSYEICRRLVRAAVCGPFDEAIRVIAEMTGLSIPNAARKPSS